MTKIYMIILLIVSILFLTNQKINSLEINENNIKEYFKNYDKLSNDEKKSDMKNVTEEFIELKKLYDRQTKREAELTKDLDNKYYPIHSLNAFILAGIDKKLEIDCYTGVEYKRFFLEGRAFLGFGGAVKIYNELGGALTLSGGFCWKGKK